VLFDREARQIVRKSVMRQQEAPDESASLKIALMNWLKSSSIAQPFFGDGLLQLENTGLGFKKKYAYNYFEVQYQKPHLNLADVETFTFTKTPPSAELVQILRAYGIKIYDATNASAEPVLISE
jgi:hypothetical protein